MKQPEAPSFANDKPLRMLALETSTDQLSVAVGVRHVQANADGAHWQLWSYTGAGGSQSSATLIPAVFELLQQGELALPQLDTIAVGIGPGSFTGLRTACSVAQGLALGANLPVLPVPTLLAVAEAWRHQHAPAAAQGNVWAMLDARMDEIYAAHWQWQTDGTAPDSVRWHCLQEDVLVRPEDVPLLSGMTEAAPRAGNVQAIYGERLGVFAATPAMPTAEALLRLAPALLRQGAARDAAQVLPHYVRNKVGQTTAERAAIKAAQAAHISQAASST